MIDNKLAFLGDSRWPYHGLRSWGRDGNRALFRGRARRARVGSITAREGASRLTTGDRLPQLTDSVNVVDTIWWLWIFLFYIKIEMSPKGGRSEGLATVRTIPIFGRAHFLSGWGLGGGRRANGRTSAGGGAGTRGVCVDRFGHRRARLEVCVVEVEVEIEAEGEGEGEGEVQIGDGRARTKKL